MAAGAELGRPPREASPSWRGSARTVLPVWAAFTALRWVVALLAGHVFTTAVVLAPGLPTLVGRWDADIFTAIAGDGYRLDENSLRAAFFPGWPLVQAAVGWPVALAVDRPDALRLAAAVLTTGCSLVAAFLIHRITWERFGRSAAGWAVVLLMAWPSAAFLTTLYSEGLYLVAAMGAWWYAIRRRWLLAGLLCGLASFTRVNGVFLLAALLVMYVTTVGRHVRWADVGRIMVGAWGTAVYFVYLWARTGDPVAWFRAQGDGWGRHSEAPWSSFLYTWDLMTGTTGTESWDKRWQMAADIGIVVIWVALSAVMGRWRMWPELALTLLTLASVATSTYYLSVTRSSLTVFPLMIVGGSLLARAGPVAAVGVTAVSTVWMSTVMGVFALGYWAG